MMMNHDQWHTVKSRTSDIHRVTRFQSLVMRPNRSIVASGENFFLVTKRIVS